jgi:hypothetical protein
LKVKDYIGRTVRLLRNLETQGGARFAAGEVLRVSSVHRGRLALVDDSSIRLEEGCLRVRTITKVSPLAVELLPEEQAKDPR